MSGACNGCTANSYISPQSGGTVNFTENGIRLDSEYECIQFANQMRAQGIYVFSIGLSASASDPVNSTFLQEVANDPISPTYDPTQPVGMALVVTDPSQLDAVFKQIAEQILLRITQ